MEVRQAALSQKDTAALAEARSFTASAEGIETRGRVRLVHGLECETLQENHISKPVAAAANSAPLERRLSAHKPLCT